MPKVEKSESTAAHHASAQQQPAQPKQPIVTTVSAPSAASALAIPLPLAVEAAVVHSPPPAAAAPPALTRAEFEKLTIEGVIAFLASKEIVLPEAVLEIFHAQMIDGDGLLGMTIGTLRGLESQVVWQRRSRGKFPSKPHAVTFALFQF